MNEVEGVIRSIVAKAYQQAGACLEGCRAGSPAARALPGALPGAQHRCPARCSWELRLLAPRPLRSGTQHRCLSARSPLEFTCAFLNARRHSSPVHNCALPAGAPSPRAAPSRCSTGSSANLSALLNLAPPSFQWALLHAPSSVRLLVFLRHKALGLCFSGFVTFFIATLISFSQIIQPSFPLYSN